MKDDPYFLPYQARWLRDKSRLKIMCKSRRIGITYVQAYEDVTDAATDEGMDVWFSSADQSAALEYIRYCTDWAKMLNIAAEDLGEQVLDEKSGVAAKTLRFTNGRRIHGLSSNPKAFRSKGGKLVLDEFAFHPDPDALWKAAAPIVTWGYPVRVISTFNGKGNRYARMVSESTPFGGVPPTGPLSGFISASGGAPPAGPPDAIEDSAPSSQNNWSLHQVTIEDAIGCGLVDTIKGKKASKKDTDAFRAECRAIAGDEETYQQEYLCIPVDEATAWLTWDMITACESAQAGNPEHYQGGECYIGMDIGRRRDLTVIWVIEKVGDVLFTREVVSLKGASFAAQDAELNRVFAAYKVARACIDQTGLGMKPVEDAQGRYGSYRVEGVTFTGPIKQHLAGLIKQVFEDRRCRIPVNLAIRNSHHAVRKTTTAAGNPRFDADRSEVGHADEFWAHALALHAAEDVVAPAYGVTIEPDPRTYIPQSIKGGMADMLRPRHWNKGERMRWD